MIRSIICKVQTTRLKRFYNVFLGQLRPGVKNPLDYFFPGRRLHIFIFSKLMDTFTKSLIIQFGHPGLFQHTSDEYILCTHLEWPCSIYSSPSNLFARCQSYGIGKGSKLKGACWTKSHLKVEKPPKTRLLKW